MKKLKNKKFSCIILTLLLFSFIFVGAGCTSQKYKTFESEYFIFQVSLEDEKAIIIGLTDSGKEQEYLIIPEFLNGFRIKAISEYVVSVGQAKKLYEDWKSIGYNSENLKRVYINSDIEIYNRYLSVGIISKSNCPHFERLIYIKNNTLVDSSDRLNNTLRTSLIGSKNHAIHISAANVSYFYNYENSPNDNYYWIDDYAYGKKIEIIPPVPTRDGYTFDGWYKESECVNAWNFNIDALPSVLYDEAGNKIYQETKLYAKWIEIGG